MDTIRVNFNKAVPIFPLPGIVLLPHSRIPLHIFEPRYRQMINRTLDEAGQFAMAVFRGDDWQNDYNGNPPIRPVVCMAQIVQHQTLAQGRYNILIQGVCRARVKEEISPTSRRLYREAILEPIEPEPIEDESMLDVRETMRQLIEADEFQHLTAVEALQNYIHDDDVPMAALLDVVGVALLNDPVRKYRLLSCADLRQRGEFIVGELAAIQSLIHKAGKQDFESWPKGVSFN